MKENNFIRASPLGFCPTPAKTRKETLISGELNLVSEGLEVE